MILNTIRVDQTIDRDRRGRFVKELVLVRVHGATDPGPFSDEGVPLAMVRKRSIDRKNLKAVVVLIHGYGQNRYAFHLPARSMSCYLADAGFDVYSLELRGHGRSRHLGAHPPPHVTHFVSEDVPAALDEVRKLSGDLPIFLVGHSLGGLISYAASASEASGEIAGVVTLGSPYQFTRGSRTLHWVGSGLLALDQRLHLGHGALELKPIAEMMRLARGILESPLIPLPIRGFAQGSMEPQVLSQHMSLAMDIGSVTVLRNMFKRAEESRLSGHRLGGLGGYASAFEASRVPVLVIAGTKDDLAPPLSVEPAYRRSRSPDRTYRTFPRGHIDLLVGRDAPLTIWPLIEAWIATRARRAQATSTPPPSAAPAA